MSSSIPKLIWQTSKSLDDLPDAGKRSILSWSSLNPTWSYQFCSSQDHAEFFQTFFPLETARLFESMPPGPLKTDCWHYAVLYEFGGVSTDIASICRQPLDAWLNAAGRGKGLHVACDNDLPQFCHRTIVATKGHPVLKMVLELLTEQMDLKGLCGLSADPQDRSIGAEIWTEAIQRYLGRKEEPMTLYHQRASLADKDIEIHPCYFFNGVKVRQQAGSEALGC